MPDRYTSATYAPYTRVSDSTPRMKSWSICTPQNVKSMSCGVRDEREVGEWQPEHDQVDRDDRRETAEESTYAIANQRNGAAALPGSCRMVATTRPQISTRNSATRKIEDVELEALDDVRERRRGCCFHEKKVLPTSTRPSQAAQTARPTASSEARTTRHDADAPGRARPLLVADRSVDIDDRGLGPPAVPEREDRRAAARSRSRPSEPLPSAAGAEHGDHAHRRAPRARRRPRMRPNGRSDGGSSRRPSPPGRQVRPAQEGSRPARPSLGLLARARDPVRFRPGPRPRPSRRLQREVRDVVRVATEHCA